MEKAIEASKTQRFKSTPLQLRAGASLGLEARARPLELFFVKSSPARPWIPKDTGAGKSAQPAKAKGQAKAKAKVKSKASKK